MTDFDFHYGVFIGRFQPLHLGHQHVIEAALKQVKTLIIVIGSSETARSIKNPFTYEERLMMLKSEYRFELETGRIIVTGIHDDIYDDGGWEARLRKTVNAVILSHGNGGGIHIHGTNDFKVALTGYAKDGSSYYLNKFPEWSQLSIESQYSTFNSSEIRVDYFRRKPMLPRDVCADGVCEMMRQFWLLPTFTDLVEEMEYYDRYWKAWAGSPFTPFMMTADIFAMHRGKVLLVTRGRAPGKGLLALPGGFINEHEDVWDAGIRELKEETNPIWGDGGAPLTDKQAKALLGAPVQFGAPGRSLRGRVVTEVFPVQLPDLINVTVVGGDDARDAAFYDFGTLPRLAFFEDHHSIITKMLAA